MPGMDLGGRKPRREAPATVQWPNPGLRTVGGVVRPGVQRGRQSHAPSGAPSSRSGVARLTAPCAVESARLSVCGYDSLIRRLGTIGGITLAVTGAAVYAGCLGLWSTDQLNMCVFGWVLHSGPSKPEPVTGMPFVCR